MDCSNPDNIPDVIPSSEYKGIEFVTLIVTDYHITIRYCPYQVQLACNYDNYSLLS